MNLIYKTFAFSMTSFSALFVFVILSSYSRVLASLNVSLFTCNPTCLTCSGPNPQQCSTCVSSFSSNNGTCTCANGKYYTSGLAVCQNCDSSCQTCNGGTRSDCLTCRSGYQLYQGSCHQSCTPTQYFNSVTFSCSACSSLCQTCSGPSASECKSCSGANLINGTCTCLSGYFVTTFGGCTACNSACKECSGASATQCTACKPGMILQNGVCTCETGSFLIQDFSSCLACNETCLGCSGAASNQCTSCKNNLILSSSKRCECPSGMYYNSQNHSCLTCSSLCDECSGSGANQCTSCRNNLVLLNHQCVCPSGTYLNTTTATCIPCDSTCQECTGPSSTQCSSCSSQNSLTSGQCKCTSGSCHCSSGQYYDSIDTVCRDCDSTCAQCSGSSANSCTVCATGFSLSNGKCVCQQSTCNCASGTYFQTSSSICIECSSSCEECSGSQSNQCTSCTNNLVLFASATVTGTCICPTGTYLDQQPQMCLDCSSTCLTCSGPSSTQCLQCQSDTMLLSDGSCVCSTGFYHATDVTTCLSCDSSCQTCSGPERSQCLSCSSAAHTLQNGYCVTTCQQNEYRTSDMSCQPCDESCQTCSGSKPNQCTSCVAPLTFSNNTCSEISSNGCYYNCKSCLSSFPYRCTQCNTDLYLIEDTGSYGYCSNRCPIGYYSTAESSQKLCKPKILLNNELEYSYSNSSAQIQITFDRKITSFLSELVNSIEISLDLRADQTHLDFTYSLDLMPCSQALLLTLTYSGDLLPGNVLIIAYNLPNYTDSDNKSTIYVLHPTQSIRIKEYSAFAISGTTYNSAVAKFASVGSIINQMFSWTSAIIFRGMHAIRSEIIEDMIGYVIFMNIDFTANLNEFAKDGLNSFEVIFPNLFEYPMDYLEAKEATKDNKKNSRYLQDFRPQRENVTSSFLNGSILKLKRNIEKPRILVNKETETAINKNLSTRYFLLNHGAATAFMIIVVITVIFIEVCQFGLSRTRHFAKLRAIVQKASFAGRWNLLIGHFSSEYQGFVFFSLLELTSNLSHKGSTSSLNLAFSIMFFFISVVATASFFVLPFIIVKKLKLMRTEADPVKTIDLKNFLQRFEILFEAFKQNEVQMLLYPALLHLRSFWFGIMLIFASGSAYAQILYLLLSTIAIIIYLLRKKPFKSRNQHFLTLIYEVIFLLIIIGVLSLHIYNQNSSSQDLETRTFICLLILILAMVLFLVNCINFLFETVEFIRGRPRDKKVVPLKSCPSLKIHSIDAIKLASDEEDQKTALESLIGSKIVSGSLQANYHAKANSTNDIAGFVRTGSRQSSTRVVYQRREVPPESRGSLKSIFLPQSPSNKKFVRSSERKLSHPGSFDRKPGSDSPVMSAFVSRSIANSRQGSAIIENKLLRERELKQYESNIEKNTETSDKETEDAEEQKTDTTLLNLHERERVSPVKSRFGDYNKMQNETWGPRRLQRNVSYYRPESCNGSQMDESIKFEDKLTPASVLIQTEPETEEK